MNTAELIYNKMHPFRPYTLTEITEMMQEQDPDYYYTASINVIGVIRTFEDELFVVDFNERGRRVILKNNTLDKKWWDEWNKMKKSYSN